MRSREICMAGKSHFLLGALALTLLSATLPGQQAAPPSAGNGNTQPTPPPSARDGAALFGKSGCPFCHGPQGGGTDKAPNIQEVRKRKTDDEIFHQIHDGGKMMPPFADALTEDEIHSLVLFLRAEDGWQMLPKN